MSKANMNYRVGVCGWPTGCFDKDGNQIMKKWKHHVCTARKIETARRVEYSAMEMTG